MITIFCIITAIVIITTNLPSAAEFIPSYKLQYQVENSYIQTVLPRSPAKPNDTVCALTKFKKIALCQRVFELNKYRQLGVHLSKISFSIAKPNCVRKKLRFRRISTMPHNTTVTQWMYPCYGTHKPVRTSFIEDDYYAKYYVSAGPTDNSIIIYSQQYDADQEWYIVHDMLENIVLSDLPNRFITISEMTRELFELNIEISRNNDPLLIEFIYQREKEYIPEKDPVCDLSLGQKISLCNLVLNGFYYKTILGIVLNKQSYWYIEPKCDVKKLLIRNSTLIFYQKMLACHSRQYDARGNFLADKYVRYVHVSSGTRRKSLFVYLQDLNSKNTDEKEFYLYEMIENLRVTDFTKTELNEKDLMNESPITFRQTEEILNTAGTVMVLRHKVTHYKIKETITRSKKELTKIRNQLEDLDKQLQEAIMKYNQLCISLRVEGLLKSMAALAENPENFEETTDSFDSTKTKYTLIRKSLNI